MTTVNMHDAKTNLSKLVESLVSGAEREIVISRNGKPAARIVPIEPAPAKRKFGFAKGRFEFDYDAFKALDAEIERSFNEGADPFGEKLPR